jgi:hypothetical protein
MLNVALARLGLSVFFFIAPVEYIINMQADPGDAKFSTGYTQIT